MLNPDKSSSDHQSRTSRGGSSIQHTVHNVAVSTAMLCGVLSFMWTRLHCSGPAASGAGCGPQEWRGVSIVLVFKKCGLEWPPPPSPCLRPWANIQVKQWHTLSSLRQVHGQENAQAQ
ncbi:unnamed protein product [Pleuronectes platessa]|uniref:Uncharacterized protein n=1 Tax=Pleuronectes platessa TaxID=8262 RepID=A0A9N7V074_PLEPL|nr:unnamed protein product [Pleuronectes platessa]